MHIPQDAPGTPQRVPLASARHAIRPHDDGNDQRDAVRAWQAHVDAGRIGTVAPLSPETLATLDANERALGIARPRHGAVW